MTNVLTCSGAISETKPINTSLNGDSSTVNFTRPHAIPSASLDNKCSALEEKSK